jgi:hypothetical protein
MRYAHEILLEKSEEKRPLGETVWEQGANNKSDQK